MPARPQVHTADICHVDAGELFLGDKLRLGGEINLNPLAAAGWAGLLVNALNAVPVGVS
jgi:hypothetical protein